MLMPRRRLSYSVLTVANLEHDGQVWQVQHYDKAHQPGTFRKDKGSDSKIQIKIVEAQDVKR